MRFCGIFTKLNNFICTVMSRLGTNGTGEAPRDEFSFGSGADTNGDFFGSLLSGIVSFFKIIFEFLFQFFSNIFTGIFDSILTVLSSLLYSICRFALNIIDFFMVFIKELVGQNTAKSILQNQNLEEADIIFKFLFSPTVLNIITTIIGVSIVLLIIFSVIAIVRTEFVALETGDNSKMSIFKRMLTSFFLFILVPIIAVFGILASNTILASVANALSVSGGNVSIGSEIFLASSYNANWYRTYAEKNKKIPMLMSTGGSFYGVTPTDYTVLDSSVSASELNMQKEQLKASSKFTQTISTFYMFFNKNFPVLNKISADTHNYYAYYDGNVKTMRIEYYVMADAIDFLAKTGTTLYFMSAEEVYKSQVAANAEIKGVNRVSGLTESGEEELLPGVESLYYYFTVNYAKDKAADEEGLNADGKMSYISPANTNDEVFGTKYMLCKIDYKMKDNQRLYYYTPLCNGDVINGVRFDSEYLDDKSPFIARGIFKESGYPTVIRKVNGNTEFYRQDVSLPALIEFLPKISYEGEDGSHTSGPGLFTLFTGIELNELVPRVYMDLDFITVFDKGEVVAGSLEGGQFYVNYNFSIKDVAFANIYKPSAVNYFILIFSICLLFSLFVKAIFGLITRIFDIVLLAISYPVFIATYPLDKGERFKSWTDSAVSRVLGIYGIIISLNVVFLLISTVTQIQVFQVGDVMLTGTLMTESTVRVLNFMSNIMFLLVLFTFITTGAKFIGEMISNFDVIKTGEESIKTISNVAKKASDIVSGRAVINMVKATKSTVMGFVPGSALMGRYNENRKMKEENKASKGLQSTLRSNMRAGLTTGTGPNQKVTGQADVEKDTSNRKKKYKL